MLPLSSATTLRVPGWRTYKEHLKSNPMLTQTATSTLLWCVHRREAEQSACGGTRSEEDPQRPHTVHWAGVYARHVPSAKKALVFRARRVYTVYARESAVVCKDLTAANAVSLGRVEPPVVADDATAVRCGLRRGLGDVCAQRLTMAHRRRVSAGRGESTRYTMVRVRPVSSIFHGSTANRTAPLPRAPGDG
jgi:hypothetical protein